MEFNTFTLPNGIRCIHTRVPSEVAHCALTINAGSRDELPTEHGIAHLTEHALFKGTAKRRPRHINSRLENLGGELNAFTTKEDTTIHATTLRVDFPKAAELIADIVFNSTFPLREIELERKVVLDEINSYLDMPSEQIFDDFEERMFNGIALGRNIVGTEISIERMTPEMIGRFVRRTYTPDQMVFSAVGNMSENAFRKVCERYFGGVERSVRDFERVGPFEPRPFGGEITKANSHQVHSMMGSRGYGMLDPRRYALSMLVNILGGPAANSRLNTQIRERNGLSYSIEAGYTPFSDCGFVSVYFSCDKRNFSRCRDLARAEIDRLVQSPLSERQLTTAKRQFIGQCTVAMESNEGRMLNAAKTCLVHDRVATPEDVARVLEPVTTEDMLTIARDVMGGKISTLTYF